MKSKAASVRSRPALTVVVTNARGKPVRGTGLERWLPQAAPPSARGAVTVAIVDDRTMRVFNRRYRGADYATDVLSFPAGDMPAEPAARPRARGAAPPYLGDIVIAKGVAGRQAGQFGHSRAVELRVLALHGLLHLLGYDHEADDGRMKRVEERLRRRAGLPAGLTARGTGPAPRQ